MPTKKKKPIGKKDVKGMRGRQKADYGKPVKAANVKGLKQAQPAPEFFKFAKFGDSVEGHYIDLVKAKKKGYSDSLMVRTPGGGILNVPYQTNINTIFTLNEIEKGDYVVITFEDVITMSSGRQMKKFNVQFAKGSKKGKK